MRVRRVFEGLCFCKSLTKLLTVIWGLLNIENSTVAWLWRVVSCVGTGHHTLLDSRLVKSFGRLFYFFVIISRFVSCFSKRSMVF